MNKKRGQIWVETVIYTLIAMILIGLVLAFVTPKIEEIQDRVIIEQTIDLMGNLENLIFTIGDVPGNKRIVDIGIKRGNLIIDAENETIRFELESEYEYSEVGEEINIGSISVKTERVGSTNRITLTSVYEGYDLTYNGENTERTIGQSSTPYKLSVENKGNNINKIIDLSIV